jgi:hypothetical protein
MILVELIYTNNPEFNLRRNIMKRFIFISMLTVLIPLVGFGQNQQIIDDIYFKPSDAKIMKKQTTVVKQAPNYKNGAREIVYIDRNNGKNVVVQRDTVLILAQANDSTERILNDSTGNNQENGYYLNGFNGSESDLEYADRIHRFHDPKYQIFIGDPRYNDINFLNNYDWNVYVDGSYAYVTPTWTNPYWWNYNLSPFSYWNNWNNPWGYNGMYGGFGFGGYYGFDGLYGYGMGYPYYGYGYGYGYPYYGYGYGDSYGYNGNGFNYNSKHDEANRREISNSTTPNVRLGGNSAVASSRINAGGMTTQNPYTVVTNSGRRNPENVVSNSNTTRTASSSTNANNSAYTSRSNGIGLVRTSNFRTSNSPNTTYVNRTINTAPRTTSTNINSNVTSSGNQASSYRSSGNSTSYRNSNNSSGNVTRSSSSDNNNSSYSSGRSTYSSSPSSAPSYSGSSSSNSNSGGGSRSSSSGRR